LITPFDSNASHLYLLGQPIHFRFIGQCNAEFMQPC
jgi:hypothetical protein